MGLANKDSASQLVSLYESVMQCEAVDVPPAIVQEIPAFSQTLVNFIKNVENPHKVGRRNGKWYAHKDPSRGILVGYGHRILPGQNFSNGLTDAQVERLLQQDLHAASIKARYYVNHSFGKDAWENLDNVRREMLIEFVYNLGSLNSFPKFTKAVVYNDIAGMKREYERSAEIGGVRKPLTLRNQAFFDTFLSNYHGGYFISRQ